MIDRLMSRIRIQNKVLVLVMPFVLSITAVGLTGLYTSGLLQGRMEISNSVIQSLSGFKGVFSAMSRFLMQPSDETHLAAEQILEAETAKLKAITEALRAEADVGPLDEALARAASISTNIQTLWGLHQDLARIATEITTNTETLLGVQSTIGKQAFVLLAAAKTKEKAAKAGLAAAVQLGTLGADGDALSASAASSADAAAILKAGTPAVSAALDGAAKALGKTSVPAVATLKSALASRDVAAISTAAGAVNQAADETMRKAVADLAASEAEIAKADRVGNKLRAIVGNANQIRVVFAELAASPDEASVKKVQQALYAYGKELDGLLTAAPEDTVFPTLLPKAKPALGILEANAAAIARAHASQRTEFDAATAEIDGTWALLSAFAESQRQSAGTERQQANTISLGAMLAGIVIAMLAGAALVITLKGPIGQITSAMRRLADGALDTRISGESRSDEIGDMARALSVFKGSALAKLGMEQQAEAARLAAEADRQRNEAERRSAAGEVQFVVDTLAQALSRLSRGDISFRIETPFAAHLDRLRTDFNASVSGLNDTMREIHGISGALHGNGEQIADAIDELAQRTEQQAAALEETSSSVQEASGTVRDAAARATEIRRIVQATRRHADDSSLVVGNAVSAMGRIKDASDKISQIVDVIDGIAFQTNLLALNAGVEAARAGEAGKGFAVVAQEVRELAQRSATAAKEIGGLIGRSSDEVDAGSRYVAETGGALTEIARQIVDIAGHVDLMATSSQDQSTSLQSLSGSVNEIDRMTQRNAAMVEETNAATQQLAGEIATLTSLIERFRLSETAPRTARAA